jgi:DNA polymerase III alpha subunit
MKYLVWLGIEEKGTYDIIKKIAKKKFKEKELEELKSTLLQGWVKNVGTEDGFSETWQVVEDAAHYSFNASHSLSVAIDSIYGAYLKSHYPLEYFTVVLTLYADDIDRTSKLIEELPYFNIAIRPVKYSKSGSSYTMDKDNNVIYKGISSIKYCNSQIAEELLELSKNKYDSFMDLLKDIKEKTSVNSRQLDILIKLNFFDAFGKNKTLLKMVDIYDKFANVKVISKKKVEELELSDYVLEKHCKKQTKSQWRDIDNVGLIKELCDRVDNESIGIVEQISSEIEFLGYVDYTNKDISDSYYIVTAFDDSRSATRPYCTLYKICDGEKIETRVNRSEVFKRNPFGLYSVISMPIITYEYKKIKDGDKWIDSDEMRVVMSEFEVIK